MALFPKSKEQKKISDLKIGESCFTVPWAMWVRTDGECFLNEDYSSHDTPGGTVELKIDCVEGGYIAHIYDVKSYKWSKSDEHGFNSPDNVCNGKVVGFGKVKYEQLSTEELGELMNDAVKKENYELATEIRKIVSARTSV